MHTFTTLEDVAAAANTEIGTTAWMEVTQDQVDRFADATGDHQWIHVDPEQAAQGPFGGTIAHGFLTLSLLPKFNLEVFSLDMAGAKLNYGLNKVRFPQPVPVGSRIRSTVSLGDVTDILSGKQMIVHHTVEVENGDKPACVAELVVLLLTG